MSTPQKKTSAKKAPAKKAPAKKKSAASSAVNKAPAETIKLPTPEAVVNKLVVPALKKQRGFFARLFGR